MKRFKKLLAVSSALTLIFATACGTTNDQTTTTSTETDSEVVGTTETDEESSTTSGEKVLYVNSPGGEPGSLQPGLAQGTHESWPLDHMFKGLYTKSPDGGVEQAIAETVDVSEDGLVWTFGLKEFTWSSGNEGTANDFVEAVTFTLNPDNAAKYAANLWVVENGQEFNSGQVGAEELGIKALDDRTLEIRLVTPLPYLPDLLTNPFFYPIDSVVAQEHEDWYMSPDNYSSNGPFNLTKWVPKEEMVLSRNEYYYDNDKTNLDKISFSMVEDKTTEWQMYEQGQLDFIYTLLPDVSERALAEGNEEVQFGEDLATYYYYLNTEVAPFNNEKVRRALAMSIDRDVIVNNVSKSGELPAYSLTPPGVPDETGRDFVESMGETFSYDVEEARALLAEGLAEEGMDINTWTFTLLYNTNDNHKRIAEAIQAMWSTNLGVNCTLENAEFQTVLERRSAGDFEVCRAGWSGDYVDPMTFLQLFTSDSEFNDGKWSSEEYDTLIQSALYNVNPEERMEELRAAESVLMEEMGVIPIYYYSKTMAMKPEVTGVHTPINRHPNFEFADKVQ